MLRNYMYSVKLLLFALLLLTSACGARVSHSLEDQPDANLAKHMQLKSEAAILKVAIKHKEKELAAMKHGKINNKQPRHAAGINAKASDQYRQSDKKQPPVLVKTRPSSSDQPVQKRMLSLSSSSSVSNYSGGVVGPGDVLEIHYYRNSLLQNTPYEVGAGDVLKVSVYNHPDLTQERVLVLRDGYISVPLINRFRVAGKNVDAISQGLAEILQGEKIRNPKVTVSVVESDQRLKTLFGSLTRSSGITIRVDSVGYLDLPFIGPVQTGRSLTVIQAEIQNAYQRVFAGQLEVAVNISAAAVQKVYVIGEVSKPGEVDYFTFLNPVMAISSAGGFLPTADLSKVHLVRYSADGTNKQWEINLEDIMDKQQENSSYVQVLPQDVIYVPKSGVAVANQFVDQYIRRMLPISIGGGFSYPIGPRN